jgi:hypothetical protein
MQLRVQHNVRRSDVASVARGALAHREVSARTLAGLDKAFVCEGDGLDPVPEAKPAKM